MNATPDQVSPPAKAKRRRVAGRRAVAFVVCFVVFFILPLIVLAISPESTLFEYGVFRIVLALAAAGMAAMFLDFLEVGVSNLVKAGGTLAVFVTVFLFSPAQLAVEEVPRTASFIASIDEASAVKGRFQGEAVVTGKTIRVIFEEGSGISVPARAPDGGYKYIEYVSVGLACASNGAWREVSRSRDFTGNIGVGEAANLEQYVIIIPRSKRKIDGCWLVFDIAVKNNPEDQRVSLLYAHTDKGLF